MAQAVRGEPVTEPDTKGLPPILLEQRATFVTLHKNTSLRGCIGRLEAVQPLILDIVEHAEAAALHDPRFDPVQPEELDALVLSISILSPAKPMTIRNEADLVSQLVPRQDGLILQDGPRRVTFLPSVWDDLPDASDFVRQLKRKAGWSDDHWSPTMRAFRYSSYSIEE